MSVNGEKVTKTVPPMARLLDVLREDLVATGTKEGCGEGECGACNVFLDGLLVNSCLVPAAQCQGASIVTIEGQEQLDILETVQKSFLLKGGAQCGICTPGMILSAVNILQKNCMPSVAEVKESLSGNLCRCTGYAKIIESVLHAASSIRGDI